MYLLDEDCIIKHVQFATIAASGDEPLDMRTVSSAYKQIINAAIAA